MPARVDLKDGLNKLPSGEIFNIIIEHKFVNSSFSLNLKELKEKGCQVINYYLEVVLPAGSILILVLIGLVICYRRRQNKKMMIKTETVDLNPYYGADNMEDRTEVKDMSEYYEYATAEDNIVFTDTNDLYI